MKTILIAEDTASEMALINNFLAQEGYKIINASNGKEALTKILAKKPDLLITDLVMPEMSGLELCRKLRKNPNTQDLPIIACTSKNKDLDKTWGMRQGVDVYITKPYTKEQIIEAVASAIKS